MQLLVVRHAIAEPRETFHGADGGRPLTEEGRKRMRRGARGLHKLVPELALVATSPLLRATQTAEILAEAYGGLETVETAALEPATHPEELAKWLAARADGEPIAVVGHEPDLSAAITWFLTGDPSPCLQLGKGGAALVDFGGAIGASRGSLVWLLRPGQLRALA